LIGPGQQLHGAQRGLLGAVFLFDAMAAACMAQIFAQQLVLVMFTNANNAFRFWSLLIPVNTDRFKSMVWGPGTTVQFVKTVAQHGALPGQNLLPAVGFTCMRLHSGLD
jgi:hypothetical protein